MFYTFALFEQFIQCDIDALFGECIDFKALNNFVFAILTFASILGPFATKLPLDVEMPELFPGLTVPMHFFPALAWFTLKPLFIKK